MKQPKIKTRLDLALEREQALKVELDELNSSKPRKGCQECEASAALGQVRKGLLNEAIERERVLVARVERLTQALNAQRKYSGAPSKDKDSYDFARDNAWEMGTNALKDPPPPGAIDLLESVHGGLGHLCPDERIVHVSVLTIGKAIHALTMAVNQLPLSDSNPPDLLEHFRWIHEKMRDALALLKEVNQ